MLTRSAVQFVCWPGILVLEPISMNFGPWTIFPWNFGPGTSFPWSFGSRTNFPWNFGPRDQFPWSFGSRTHFPWNFGPGDQSSMNYRSRTKNPWKNWSWGPIFHWQTNRLFPSDLYNAPCDISSTARTNDSAASSPATRATGSTLHMVANSHAIYFLIVI